MKEQEFKGHHPTSIVYQYSIKSAVRAEHFFGFTFGQNLEICQSSYSNYSKYYSPPF